MIMSAKEQKKPNERKVGETAKLAGIFALFAGAGYAIYRLLRGEAPSPCTPGATKCEGYNLYTCSVEEKWELTEESSPQCGWQPPEVWFKDREALGRKDFILSIISGGWVKDNEEMGREDFSITVIDAGWRGDNEELGRQNFSITIIPEEIDEEWISVEWQADRVALGRKNFSIKII